MSKHVFNPEPHSAPKKNKALPIVLGVVLAVVLILLLSVFFVFRHFYNSMNIQPQLQESPAYSDPITITLEDLIEEEEEPEEGALVLTDEETTELDAELQANVADNELFGNDDVYNILLLGNDSRADTINERTDVMLLVSINTTTEDIMLTSFLRDIYLYIPGYFSHRLNTANALAGPDLTVATIEQNFGIDIDSYAQVNFYAFVDIIDTLGGVDLYLTGAEARVVGCGYDEGTYHLDGAQALSYCRIRKLDSDFGRTARQRKLLEALWEDLKDSSATQAYSIMTSVLPEVTTNLTQADCLNLLAIATQISDYDLYSTSIPIDGAYSFAMISGMSVLKLNFSENIDYLRYFIYDEPLD